MAPLSEHTYCLMPLSWGLAWAGLQCGALYEDSGCTSGSYCLTLLLLLAVQWAASVLCDPTGSAAAQKSKLCCARKRNGG